ncbi:DinB family protein [Mucilaginibacter sp. FT3.2]|uniref:DinB family protein n=1 Tax=Mucilaginibacter sp. FT3.2 TaxID=2723090 RepID=UPI0016165862|nr:DinB family protein [Mucilaginibacter sp. FT3.2]MBB6229669.1 putative damage-inducible protein DinB [Mucilaginibacter sp. FT3.2]
MNIIPIFLKELEQEAQTTRKMLEIVPTDKFQWQPHPKSMTIEDLTVHIVDLPNWLALAAYTDGLNFATEPYTPAKAENAQGLLNLLEQSVAKGKEALQSITEEELVKPWVLSNGDVILQNYNKAEVIRVAFNQLAHHRAQLGVYLRLLNVPIPGSYGPSADELSGEYQRQTAEAAV